MSCLVVEFGRDKGAFEFTTPLKTENGVPPTLDQLERMEVVGVTRATVAPWGASPGRLTIDHMLAGIESYGTKVIAKLE